MATYPNANNNTHADHHTNGNGNTDTDARQPRPFTRGWELAISAFSYQRVTTQPVIARGDLSL